MHHWIGQKLGKISNFFGDEKFESKKITLATTNIFLGVNFHIVLTNVFDKNMEFFSLYYKFKKKSQRMGKLANLLRQQI